MLVLQPGTGTANCGVAKKATANSAQLDLLLLITVHKNTVR